MTLSRKTPMPRASKPMQAGKPLNPGTKGLTRTPFRSRAAPLPRSALPCTEKPAAVPKPRKAPVVTAEEKRARLIVKARAGGRCEGCGRVGRTDWSHRIGRGVGGPWCPSNGLALCRLRCHAHIGAEPKAARDQLGWRLESTDTPTEMPTKLHGVGWVLLDQDGGVSPVDEADALQVLRG